MRSIVAAGIITALSIGCGTTELRAPSLGSPVARGWIQQHQGGQVEVISTGRGGPAAAEGKLLQVDGAAVHLLTANGSQMTLDGTSALRVRYRKRARGALDGALKGALVGLLPSMLVGLATGACSEEVTTSGSSQCHVARNMAISIMVGVGTSMAIGSLVGYQMGPMDELVVAGDGR